MISLFKGRKAEEALLKYTIEQLVKKEVPECFHFNATRNLIIVRVADQNGFLIFGSRQSYETFKDTTSDKSYIAGNIGNGVPLMEIAVDNVARFRDPSDLKSLIFGVYVYEVRSIYEPPPYDEYTVIQNNGGKKLFKIPFCEVSCEKNGFDKDYKFHFVYSNAMDDMRMGREFMTENYFTNISGYVLKWEAFEKPPAANKQHLSLQLMENIEKMKVTDANRLTVAHYTEELRGKLNRIINHEADLYVGEKYYSNNYDINDIPLQTKIIAAEALVIHYIQHLKREIKKKDANCNCHHTTNLWDI
ncbi:hypothetical protein Kpol_1015p14 [Vanderwaltozyma polyspora DSM 70294]|uniref:Uncharacterized protein n=1 Tax=Vanderwaltozyma polyspora (strain ATCC 22028 / DSM 70294 / BCRC 21397 / CBS 2163 / NBRC 10782 / NRRL Y-8283 / UCD 57-17) TaxID=436907 RepID=A7TQP3_VANPO|nr:uncharacterized protein Kpol_1015p14 [Vanderwaltozyma polyspora DSM 70294]EDO15424.1 hypothetical protein Kpol_1015p14 [Vanderwaltozyma polyspora DSM 70294]